MAGINGKMNEFQAAMGLKNLALVSREIENRKIIGNIYREELDGIDGVRCFQIPSNIRNSEQYFIIQVDEIIRPKMRDILYHMLKEFNIITRRYFYPLCSEANCYSSLPSANPLSLPVAHKVSREVLALPYYGSLRPEDAYRITECIRWSLN
jgi:dTDP-4-amino-4,6-dideoxygalactose transaminase